MRLGDMHKVLFLRGVGEWGEGGCLGRRFFMGIFIFCVDNGVGYY